MDARRAGLGKCSAGAIRALPIIVGGDESAYRRVEPIVHELGTPTHICEKRQGLVVKLAINVSLAVQMLA